MKTRALSLISVLLLGVLVGCSSTKITDEKDLPPDRPKVRAQAPEAYTPPAPAAQAQAVSTEVAKPAQDQRSVYFDFDMAQLRDDSRMVIESNAAYLRANERINVRIEGNTDERGSREYNLALGQKRADAVAKALHVLGVPAARLEAISYGKEKPVDPGHNEAAWAKNRRADIAYQNK